ncbi:MAG: hypothetical protein WC655_23395 [Candidatus Hydrogenedentales bacterium]|jgi:hypothetical protein
MAEGNKLGALLKGNGGVATTPKAAPEVSPTAVDAEVTTTSAITIHAPDSVVSRIAGIEIEAIVGGALQRIKFVEGTNPGEVLAMLKSIDGAAQVRTEFPSKSFGGKRDTKEARAIVLNVRVTDSGKFIDLISKNGEDLSVAVSKKAADTFLESLKALNKLDPKNLAKVEKAFAEKGTATIILTEPEQFGVRYWMTDDHKAFMESMTAEPPAVTEKETASE